MSAALEFAESVVSVLQLTATTISTCYNYRSRNKSASGDKKRIIDQLLGLQEVLDEVRQLVEHEETRASSRVSALIEFLNTPDGLPRCRAELDSLKAMLENIDKTERPDPTQVLVWQLKQDDVNKTINHLAQFHRSLTSVLSVDQTTLTPEPQAKALPEPSTVAKQSNKQTKLQKDRLIIDKWLSPPDHLSKHLNACKERHETTGSWFLQGEHFKGWKGLRSSFLWLHGISGAGKTILCSTIIEEISLHCKSDPSLAVAFFYFDFDDKQIRSGDVLRSLIQQLFSQCPSIPNALAKIYDYDADEDGSLMSALKSLIGSFQDVYIVLDALDECPERARFLGLLKEIHGWRLGALHLLATSQKVIDIEETLSGLVSHQVPMDESLVNGDIGFYLRKTLEDDIKLSMCSAEEKEMIKTKLVEGAHGIFRWVICQLDALGKCRSAAALEKALSHLPKNLYETYDRVLRSIDKDDRRDALNMLTWLAFSIRTLSLAEAVDVLATDPDAESGPLFDRRRRLRDPQDILAICSSLVTITVSEATVQYTDDSSDNGLDHNDARFTSPGEIRLAHSSVRDYLISEHLRTSDIKLSYYHLSQEIADVFIAKTCLAYLLQFDQHDSLNTETLASYPLCRYAARHWSLHAGSDPACSSASLQKLIMNLLEPTDSVYAAFLWLYRLDKSWELPFISPLYFTSAVGLAGVSQSLLKNGSDVNAQEGYYGNALQVASVEGHSAVIQVLLEHGADVNAQGGVYGSALEAASSEGHPTVVQLLLEKGSDVNAQGGQYGNALQAAASDGYITIVRLLLEKGADVNAQGGQDGHALQGAVYGGHDTIVRLLLEKGVDVNAQGGENGSALMAGVLRGDDTIVQLLLEKGATVNVQGGDYGIPLQAATFWGHDTIVRLLLDKGAEVNAQGGQNGTALQTASRDGYSTIVRLLLEKGADVNAQGGQYGSALLGAALGGHDTILRLLLEKGAQVNALGWDHVSALQAAVRGGHHTTVQLLLEKGAEVNVQGPYGTPLQAGAFSGHDMIVQLLLEKGADIDARGRDYGSALQAATLMGHTSIVRLLLEKGADVNAPGGHYGRALVRASRHGYDTIARLLLEKGADVNARERETDSALQAATFGGHYTTVQLLLENGADVNTQGGEYGTVLQAAAFQGNNTIVQLLLEKGADVNVRGGKYGSALQAASESGRPEARSKIIQLLVERGADLKAQ